MQRFDGVVGKPVVPRPRGGVPAPTAGLERAQSLLERFLERASDRHRLADRFHLRRQARVGVGKLLEREARNFDDDVVEDGLERRRRRLRDVVRDFVEPIADGELRTDAGNRESRRLRRQRG